MARSSRTLLDERTAALERLSALRLRPPAAGWVPDASGPELVDLVERPSSTESLALVEPVAPYEPAGPVGPAGSVVEPVDPPPIGELARAWAIDRSPPWAHGFLARAGRRAAWSAAGLVVALIAAGVLVLHHRSAGAPPYQPSSVDPAPSSVASQGAADVAPDASSIVVDVGGRVRKPGLVTLPAGARVADAIAAAGGPLHHREVATLDLAARVSDGQLLLVGVRSAAGSAAGADAPSGTGSPAPVGLNSATIDELETLPGVGPVTAQKIIDWRTAHDGFTSLIQLQQVSGIGPTRYAELSPLVTL